MKSKGKLPKGHSGKHFAMNGWQGALGVSFPWHIPAREHAWRVCREWKFGNISSEQLPHVCTHRLSSPQCGWDGPLHFLAFEEWKEIPPALPEILLFHSQASPALFSWQESNLAGGPSVPRCAGDKDQPLMWDHPLTGAWRGWEQPGRTTRDFWDWHRAELNPFISLQPGASPTEHSPNGE